MSHEEFEEYLKDKNLDCQQYQLAIDAMVYAEQKVIERAREWLKENLYEYTNMGEFVGTLSRYVYKKDTINQFIKAMEE